MDPFPLPFERVRWRTRRLAVSDFRLVALRGLRVAREIALHDISRVEVEPSLLERLTGVGTLLVHSARAGDSVIRVPKVWRARSVALRVELLVSDIRGIPPADEIADASPSSLWPVSSSFRLQILVAPVILLLTVIVVGIGLSGHGVDVAYPVDDAVRPRGVRRSDAEIVAFMEREVLPWAREALAPLVGRNRVTCYTCHGRDAEARRWTMPAVAALPEPAVRAVAEAAGSDAQMRNALHGYLAEGDNQARAGYMRGVVMPGMAKLLRRPAYDFAQSYEYNRSRAAFGCYHCHMVSDEHSE
jgi:hypothetical protein